MVNISQFNTIIGILIKVCRISKKQKPYHKVPEFRQMMTRAIVILSLENYIGSFVTQKLFE